MLAVLIGIAAATLAIAAPSRPGGGSQAHRRPALSSPAAGAGAGEALNDPIDPRFLTELPFGKSSFWIQPWRAYLDTWPVSRLRDALGINFDVKAAQAEAVARLLHESGFTLARIAINWSALSYSDPSRFVKEAELQERLRALRDNGLRPLILLDANSQGPAPAKPLSLQTLAPAPAGATQVQLSAASAAAVVPGKSGFDAAVFNDGKAKHRHRGEHRPHVKLTPQQRRQRREERRAAGLSTLVLQGNPAILITSVDPDGVATLSHPLPAELPAGGYKGTTLLYAPFASPKLHGGGANPAFRQTMDGWLSYVVTVSHKAASVFGPSGYDLEIWNELTFGSQFLDSERYEGTQSEGHSGGVGKEVSRAVLTETLAYVRDPAHGISPGVGVSDGFADQTPFASAASAPAGLTALSKHLYNNAKSFPSEFKVRRGNIPLDARGARDTVGGHGSAEALTPLFVPHFQSLFPEYFLTALQTASVVRDLAPIQTSIYGTAHGREVSVPGGRPLQVWMTEYNLSPGKGTVMGPDGVTTASGPTAKLTPADKQHFQAKALLRSLVAMISKGMTREYFFDAAPGPLSLIGEQFDKELTNHPGTYPGQQNGGETLNAFKNLLDQFNGPGPHGPPRQLGLASISQDGDHAQFRGDGTPQHPNLYDREVLAVLPFQASPTKFVIPIYVMTRNLLTLYKPNAATTDTTRYDLPNETFHITLTNLPQTTNPPTITSYDPLHGNSSPARLISSTPGNATIEIAATDYPRILDISYSGQ